MPARPLPVRLLRSRASGRLLALVGAVLLVIGVTTLPASAHHAIVNATGHCDGTVSYTSTAWNGQTDASRTNSDIRIQAQYGNGAWVEVGKGSFSVDDHFTFGGTFTPPANAFPFQVRAAAVAKWGDNAGPGSPTSPITVGAPSGCSTPPSPPAPEYHPAASIDHTCTGWTAHLDNSHSTDEVAFTVTATGAQPVTRTVAKGASQAVSGAVTPNHDYTITVSAPHLTTVTEHFDTNACGTQPPAPQPKPAASVVVSCTGWSATLQNVGDSSTVSFQITVNGQVRTETAGSTRRTVSGPVVANSLNTVSVGSGGHQLDSDSLDTHTCQAAGRPTGSVTVTCTGWSVTTANTGGGSTPVDFTVTVNGRPSTVSTDSTPKTVTGPVVANSLNTVSVSAGGQQLDSDSLDTHTCQPPSTGTPRATIDVTCSGYDITVVNSGGTGTLPFEVTINGQTTTVQAGSTLVHVTGQLTGPPNSTYSVSQAGHVLDTDTFNTSSCTVVSPPPSLPSVAPSALIRANCTGFLTVLNNTRSNVATTFVVTTNAGTAAAKDHAVRVPAGRTTTPTAWPVKNDVAQTVTVSAPQMQTISRTFARTDCTHVSAPSTSTSTSGTSATTSSTSSTTATASSPSTAPTSGSASGLPRTGNQISALMLWVGGLLLLTGLAMMRGRRRAA